MSTKYLSGAESSFINGVGKELCWGWSPAVDFIKLLDGRMSSSSSCAASNANSNNKKAAVVGFDEDGFPIISTDGKNNTNNNNNNNTNNDDDRNEKNPSSSSENESTTNKAPINILLMGSADIRHIIMTLSRIKRTQLGKSKRPINFFIFEPSLRVHCRHLLFLQLLLVDLVTLSELEDRVSMVLEIFGNSLLRDISAGVLKNAALAVCNALDFEGHDDNDNDEEEPGSDSHELTEEDQVKQNQKINDDDDENEDTNEESASKKITSAKTVNNNNKKNNNNNTGNIKQNTRLANWLDWSNMKAKERDFIAQQILLWTKTRSDVDIVGQWDSRVRQELAERYDNRVNIFDWDFNFQLLDYTQLLRFPEYREFRKVGQAFDYCRINPRRGFRYDYTVANKSLAHFNTRSLKGSYLGDVKVGPFFAIGQDTENSHLKKREVDGTTIYGCGVIAMHTVRGWLYELLTGNQFPTDLPHKHAWEDDKYYNMLPPKSPEPHVGFEPEVAPCCFKMVGIDIEKFLEKLVREEGEGKFFDAVFVGATCTQFMGLKNFFKSVNSDHGVVVAETLKFVLDANETAKSEFERKIVQDLCRGSSFVKNDKLTQSLHANQLAPKERTAGVELDKSSQKAILRQKMNHAIVLTTKQ